MAKTGPKGPRAKVKRVLLISGHPDCLFEEKVDTYYTMVWKNETHKLGKCGENLAKALKEMNTYAQVNSRTKVNKHVLPLPDVLKASIKKVGDNTHITVSAVDDQELAEEIGKVVDYLEELGLSVKERCHWSCDYDPGSKTAPAPVPTQAPPAHPTPAPGSKTAELQEIARRVIANKSVEAKNGKLIIKESDVKNVIGQK